MIQLTPWFLGQAGLGLSKKEATALFGPGVPMIVKPGDPPLQKQKGAEMRAALLKTFREINEAFKLEGTPSPGTTYGVRGVGLVYPHPAQRGQQHVIPIALFNPDSVKLLSEAESRALVTEPATSRPKLALEVIRTELPGGADSAQVHDIEPTLGQTALRYVLPVGIALGVGTAVIALTR